MVPSYLCLLALTASALASPLDLRPRAPPSSSIPASSPASSPHTQPAPSTSTHAAAAATPSASSTPKGMLTGKCTDALCGQTSEYWAHESPTADVMTWLSWVIKDRGLNQNLGTSGGQTAISSNFYAAIEQLCELQNGWFWRPCTMDEPDSCRIDGTAPTASRDCILAYRVGAGMGFMNQFNAALYLRLNLAITGFLATNAPSVYDALNTGTPSEPLSIGSGLSGIKNLVGAVTSTSKLRIYAMEAELKRYQAGQEAAEMTKEALEMNKAWLATATRALDTVDKISGSVVAVAALIELMKPADPELLPGADQGLAMGTFMTASRGTLQDIFNRQLVLDPFADGGLIAELGTARWWGSAMDGIDVNTIEATYTDLVVARYVSLIWKRHGVFFAYDMNAHDCSDQSAPDSAVFCFTDDDGNGWSVRFVNYAPGAGNIYDQYRYRQAENFDAAMQAIGSKFRLRDVFLKSKACADYQNANAPPYPGRNNGQKMPLAWASSDDMISIWRDGDEPGWDTIEPWLRSVIYQDPVYEDWDGLSTDDLQCVFAVPVVPTPATSTGPAWDFEDQEANQLDYAQHAVSYLVDASVGWPSGRFCSSYDEILGFHTGHCEYDSDNERWGFY